jgi:hypothetical protein
MKSTLVCVHVMPHEIEMFEQFMTQYKKALHYLDENDNVTIKASLNLNPLLTDWENSDLKQDFFINKFDKLFNNIPNINEIITDTSLMGTTQQKRESIKLNFNQFIFVDADIAFPETLLKYQIMAAEHLQEKYIIIPQLVKLWDNSWDILVHKDYLDKNYGYYNEHKPELTYEQTITDVTLQLLPIIKFGCGMHTLYSKEFWDFIDIPQSFGGYGSEDSFAMMASSLAISKGYKIDQYLLEGLYITENLTDRIPSFNQKVKNIFQKEKSKDASWQIMNQELTIFANKL